MSEKKMKAAYEVKGGKYAAVRPSARALADAQKAWNKAFREAVDAHACVRARVDSILRDQGLWDDAKQQRADELSARVAEHEKTLGRGYRVEGGKKVGLKVSEGREAALALRKLRQERSSLLAQKSALDGTTAEAQADNARFNFLVAQCLVHNAGEQEGKKVFKDAEDYAEHASEPHAFQGATLLAGMLGGGDPDWEKKLPENAFLLKYGFVDDKCRLLDKDGRVVDDEGRLLDEEGRYVNEKGEWVNRSGDRVDEEGNLVFEDAQPFLPDGPEAPQDPPPPQP